MWRARGRAGERLARVIWQAAAHGRTTASVSLTARGACRMTRTRGGRTWIARGTWQAAPHGGRAESVPPTARGTCRVTRTHGGRRWLARGTWQRALPGNGMCLLQVSCKQRGWCRHASEGAHWAVTASNCMDRVVPSPSPCRVRGQAGELGAGDEAGHLEGVI